MHGVPKVRGQRPQLISDPFIKLLFLLERDTTYGTSKARSEQEGLDCLASEVSEIESGDLRDSKQQF